MLINAPLSPLAGLPAIMKAGLYIVIHCPLAVKSAAIRIAVRLAKTANRHISDRAFILLII